MNKKITPSKKNKDTARRDFLKVFSLTGSLLVIPGAMATLAGRNNEYLEDKTNQNTNQVLDPTKSVTWFSVGGDTIYHLKAGKTCKSVPRSIFAAANSGNVLCFDYTGNKLWEQDSCKFFPFAMDVADIDEDGFDECVVASADGSLYIIDHDGTLLAKVLDSKPPLYSVKIVKDSKGNNAIYCGGPERILYQISGKGEILAQVETIGAITNIASGCFTKTGEQNLVIGMNANFAMFKFALFSIPMLNPIGETVNTKSSYLYNMIAAEPDNEGLDQIICGGAKGGLIFDAKGNRINTLQEKGTGRGQDVYTMVLLDKISGEKGHGRQIIGLCASKLRFYNIDGTLQKEVPFDISPAGFCYDEAYGTLLLGSEMSGGDTIYCIRMDRSGWEESLQNLGYQGKIRKIVSNIEMLSKQVEEFEAPSYQSKNNAELLCVVAANGMEPNIKALQNSQVDEGTSGSVSTLTSLLDLYKKEFPYPSLHFAANQWLSESWDRTKLPHGWDTKRDKRMKYQYSSNEIIEYARMLEHKGLTMVWTIGHGNDPFFLSLPTIEGILVVAPNACKGFIFPEVARDDTPAYQYALKEHLRPVCDLCLKYGKRKVFLRSKFLQWAADCYTDLWSWILEDKKYKDVIVPAMEETYERLCDLSISGRLGLQHGGWFTEWAGRADHDNVCYDREHQWASTTVGSHFLRALSYTATLGANYHLIQLSEVANNHDKFTFRDHALVVKPFLHMLGKGILPCPQLQEEKLSVSSVALGMRNPSAEFIQASHNSHEIATYKYDPKWVFSRLQSFWGQAPTPKYDFGFYGIGRRRQALNFMPVNPYGLVPVVTANAKTYDIKGVEKIIITDGEFWYDDKGTKRSAEDYAEVVEGTLKESSEKMFLSVTGEVAWTATRLDKRHVRLLLIDSGYLSPADRIAKVKVHAKVTEVRDILSKDIISLNRNSFELTIPMGILRVIDIEHA